MSGPIDGYASGLDARITALEVENQHLRELALLYCQIAFREGFRAALMWVPDQWNAEAHIQSIDWVHARRERMTADLAASADDIEKEA
jgi:hypothetical protein